MNARTLHILEATVRDYINRGIPVSSEDLFDRYDFGIKPASIRAELLRLTDDGFLRQLHTSGGRVPTEEGYQLLVSHLMERIFGDERKESFIALQPKTIENEGLESFVDEVAENFKMLGVGYNEEGECYKSGLDSLCERVDAETRDDLLEVIHDVQQLDSAMGKLMKRFTDQEMPHIFIGTQSPITRSPHLAIIADRFAVDGHMIVVATIGPKRMDYSKPLKLFKALRKSYKNNKK